MIFCPDNTNSGASLKEEYIFIWRKEEFYKVLIHELIHYFDIDFYVNDEIYKKLDKYSKNVIDVNGIDRINESYTEALAIIIHSVAYSVLKNMEYNEIIANEILYSRFQAAKILSFSGCNDYVNTLGVKIYQVTSVWSYYIVKSMMLEKYDMLISFWNKHGFIILESAEDEYENLYKNIVNVYSFDVEKMNFLIKKINETDRNDFIMRTMRMSVYQI